MTQPLPRTEHHQPHPHDCVIFQNEVQTLLLVRENPKIPGDDSFERKEAKLSSPIATKSATSGLMRCSKTHLTQSPRRRARATSARFEIPSITPAFNVVLAA